MIEAYFQVVDPLDKSGAYAIQTNPEIIERWEGSLSNVIGLPVEKLSEELKQSKVGKLDLFPDFEKLALQLDELYLQWFVLSMCRFWLSILLIGESSGAGNRSKFF